MRISRPALLLFLCSLIPASLGARQSTSAPATPAVSDPQAVALVQKALTVLTGVTNASDVTLTGTARRIAGSDDETGTATYRAVPTASRMDLMLSGGTRSEIRAPGTNAPAGNWIGPDGTVHEISLHNLLTDAGWFPIFTLNNLISSTSAVLTYVGPETKNGVSVVHIQSSQQPFNASVLDPTTWQHLTQMDIYLDASTLLPTMLDFNTHADNNALLDIPVEFCFSDYQVVGSTSIPFHVQESVNGSLFLDVQFQQASVNSGLSLSSSVFTIQ
jgi:hypothetical protein